MNCLFHQYIQLCEIPSNSS
uniref:Uncharacterized protein n=1 Tax=Arundo donax TaxID=35708 RepID=A0A0A9AQP8_ARUDO